MTTTTADVTAMERRIRTLELATGELAADVGKLRLDVISARNTAATAIREAQAGKPRPHAHGQTATFKSGQRIPPSEE